MIEKQFKTQFVASFLAAWVASEYEMACMRGDHDILKHPPVKDAEYLANAAWNEWVKVNGND